MSQVIQLDKKWWEQQRKPSAPPVVQKKRKLARQYFHLRELAERFHCGRDVLYKAITRGELEAEVVGVSYRVSLEALNRYLDLCRRKKRIG